ncbi:hypothetical protein ACFL2K_04955 [Candidatus Margulisiibacteriota bacterium]
MNSSWLKYLNILNLNYKIIFAGIGANGGDVRSFLGLTDKPGFKNNPDDNPNFCLNEKLKGRNAMPQYFKVLKKRITN